MDATIKEPQENSATSTGENDTRAKKVLSGFLRYKTHRQKKWDKIADRCERFLYGDQWEPEFKAKMRRQRRAPAVFNQILPVIDSIVGHQIQNRVDLVAKPVDRFGDPILADILTSSIKAIENMNNVNSERRLQFLDGITAGVGVKEIWPESDVDMEQSIRVAQSSPWHYYFDPRFEKYDYRDGKKYYKETWMTAKDVELTYGKKVAKKLRMPEAGEEFPELPEYNVPGSWDNNSNDYGNKNGVSGSELENRMMAHGYDQQGSLYRVVEEYEKRYERFELFFDETAGGMRRLDELSEIEQELFNPETVSTTKSYIHLTTLVADSVIAHESDIKSKKNENVEFYHIINLYFPYFINGKYFGVIENLLYPQEDINKHYSQIIHILNSYANAGVYYEEGIFDPQTESQLDDLLAMNGIHIKVERDALSQGRIKPIERHEAPQTLFSLIGMKEGATKYISGVPDEFQGGARRAQSGKAKDAQIQQASMKQLGLIENFRETQRLEGKAYLFCIQNYLTSETLLRVVGDEYGSEMQELQLNMRYFDQIINDVTIGKYDITLEYEGRTQSERDRMKYMLVELSNTVPAFADIIGKYVLQYSDMPQKDKILAEFEQRQQMMQQAQQMQMQQGQAPEFGGGARGGIQSAPRPSRGPRRQATQ